MAGTAGLIALLVAAPAGASFRPVGGSLNVDATQGARSSDLATVGGIPHVAFNDNASGVGGPLRVRRLDGSDWPLVGEPLAASPGPHDPSIAALDGKPWVAATEHANGAYQTFVSFFDGTTWQRSSSSLNLDPTKDAIQPDMAVVDGGIAVSRPYVAFSQFNDAAQRFELRVRRPSGASWETVGASPLNVNGSFSAFGADIVSAPGVRQFGGTPYVAWQEQSPPGPGADPPPPINRLYVARGSVSGSSPSWTRLGDQLNQGDAASGPRLTLVDGQPWVAWTERVGGIQQVRAARYAPPSWIPVGQSSLNVDGSKDAFALGLTNVGGAAYVVLNQRFDTAAFRDHVWVKRFDGTNWVPVGGPLNIDPALSGLGTAIAVAGGVPYVSFEQSGAGSAPSQLRVSRLEAPTCQPSTVDVPHNALAFPITLSCDEGVRAIKTSPA